jgi:hypothetical protein
MFSTVLQPCFIAPLLMTEMLGKIHVGGVSLCHESCGMDKESVACGVRPHLEGRNRASVILPRFSCYEKCRPVGLSLCLECLATLAKSACRCHPSKSVLYTTGQFRNPASRYDGIVNSPRGRNDRFPHTTCCCTWVPESTTAASASLSPQKTDALSSSDSCMMPSRLWVHSTFVPHSVQC